MPRRMPNLAGAFALAADRAVDLTTAGETARVLLSFGRAHSRLLDHRKIELLYEMAFLRIFNEWEVFLEESFIRYLCGYAGQIGPFQLTQGHHFPSMANATVAFLGGQSYKLWHKPQTVIARAQSFMVGSSHETVFSSALPDLTEFAAVRHRIAHGQKHAKAAFDQATMNLNAIRYPGSSAGRFLRDWNNSANTPIRWIHAITRDLKSYAAQIAPV